jgi:hypothetical protein
LRARPVAAERSHPRWRSLPQRPHERADRAPAVHRRAAAGLRTRTPHTDDRITARVLSDDGTCAEAPAGSSFETTLFRTAPRIGSPRLPRTDPRSRPMGTPVMPRVEAD